MSIKQILKRPLLTFLFGIFIVSIVTSCTSSKGESLVMLGNFVYQLPFFPGTDFPYVASWSVECSKCECYCYFKPFCCDCPSEATKCWSKEEEKKMYNRAKFTILDKEDRDWEGDLWKDEYEGHQTGYLYKLNGTYCKEETFPKADVSGFVKLLLWKERLWIYKSGKLEGMNYDKDITPDFVTTITSESLKRALLKSYPAEFMGYKDSLIFGRIEYADYGDVVSFFKQDYDFNYEFASYCDYRSSLILKTLSSDLYRKKYGNVLKAGGYGRWLELRNLTSDVKLFASLDFPRDCVERIFPLVEPFAFNRINKIMTVKGENGIYDEALYLFIRILVKEENGKLVFLNIPLLLSESDNLNFSREITGWTVSSWRERLFQYLDDFGLVKNKVLKESSYYYGNKYFPRGYTRKIFAVEDAKDNIIVYALELDGSEVDIQIEYDEVNNSTFIGVSGTLDGYYLTGPSIKVNGISSNLIPVSNGHQIYFQDSYDPAKGFFKGIGKVEVKASAAQAVLTHLRSDIPPANTVEYPPETSWSDNKLYVTGDGHYALLVPITFTKKCLTDNPDECIYCNRDISPNVWDYGRFNKIVAYDLIDPSRPPIEISVGGYDGYLVPSPDYMQFAFSEGDKIGILDGKTLQVREIGVK